MQVHLPDGLGLQVHAHERARHRAHHEHVALADRHQAVRVEARPACSRAPRRARAAGCRSCASPRPSRAPGRAVRGSSRSRTRRRSAPPSRRSRARPAGGEAPDQATARQRVDEDPVGQAAGHDQPVARGVDPVGEQAPVLARARGRPSASRARGCPGRRCRRWSRSRRTGPCPAARVTPSGNVSSPGRMYSFGRALAAGAATSAPSRASSRARLTWASLSGGRERTPLSSFRMDERALTERLVTYDTSTLEGMQSAAGFVKGWLEARDVEVTGEMHNGRPVLAATVGPAGRAHDRVPRPPRRGAREPRAVQAAHRRRPPLRARRLRHEGRARGDDVRPARRGRAGRRARPLPLRVRRGVGGDGRSARLHPPGPAGLHRRLRDHRRAHRPPHRRAGQGRARAAHRGRGHLRARLHALDRRQRGGQGDRRVPPDRVAAVRARVVRPLRPAVDQPRPHRRRRRHQPRAGLVRDRRGHPLPARPGRRRDPRRHQRAGRGHGHAGPSTATR